MRLLCLVLLSGLAFSQTAYRKTPVPTLGGKATAAHPNWIVSINNAGQVLGCSPDVNLQFRWYIWSASEGLRDLGIVCNGGAGKNLNDAGHAILVNSPQGMFWTQDGSQAIDGVVSGINNQDQVAGYYRDQSGTHGFLWQNSVREDLGTDSAGLINNVGQVLVSKGGSIFIWTRTEGLQPFNDTPVAYSAWNDSAQAVGFTSDAEHLRRAVLVTRTGGVQDLGVLPGFSVPQSEAWGINNLGVVVGNSYSGRGPGFAFIWSQSQGMRNLNILGGNKAQTWRAVAINDAGQIAINKKGGPAVILTPKP